MLDSGVAGLGDGGKETLNSALPAFRSLLSSLRPLLLTDLELGSEKFFTMSEFYDGSYYAMFLGVVTEL